jgi:GDPmannose 4,6-dehydratase
MSKALITGITGQDGYYLSKLLIEKGYEVFGTIRRSSSINTSRIDPLISEFEKDKRLNLFYSNLLDPSSLTNLINSIEPDEVYNLAAQSHVKVSFENPIYTAETSTLGSIALLEAIRNSKKEIKYYQASSSEMFGGLSGDILNLDSRLLPKSPYAASKVFAHHITSIYRDSYNVFGVNGILFNHESPHRGETFVTRKITRAVGRILSKTQSKLTLGNIDATRDWGFAGDYVEGMYLMMQHDQAEDWILATGKSYSVKEFLRLAFDYVGLNWEDYVEISDQHFRPNEVHDLIGDASKASKILNWEPKVSFNELVEMMVDFDVKLAQQEKLLIEKDLLKPTWENYIL